MSATDLTVTSFGLVTGVGLTAPATAAAIRGSIDGFRETRFMDSGGEWLVGCEVPLETNWRGELRLIEFLKTAIDECLRDESVSGASETPLLLCLPKGDRPGRLIADEEVFFTGLCDALAHRFHPKSAIFSHDSVSLGLSLQHAQALIANERVSQVLIAGGDSLLRGPTLIAYEEIDRLLTSKNSNGFIPGEGAGAILVRGTSHEKNDGIVISGIGFGHESATVTSEGALRADGLVDAIKSALADARSSIDTIDFRITDLAGDQYYFKEANIAITRLLRTRKEKFDIWHPADCVGNMGAASGFVGIVLAAIASAKNYIPGDRFLFHFSSDDGKRTAILGHRGQKQHVK